jgi:hypothetical protein
MLIGNLMYKLLLLIINLIVTYLARVLKLLVLRYLCILEIWS